MPKRPRFHSGANECSDDEHDDEHESFLQFALSNEDQTASEEGSEQDEIDDRVDALSRFHREILDKLETLDKQSWDDEPLHVRYPYPWLRSCVGLISEPKKCFDLLFRWKPKDEEAEEWKTIMIKQCQRMIIESCRDAVALATYREDQADDHPKNREDGDEPLCRMGSPDVSSSPEREKSFRQRLESEEAASGREKALRKKRRSDRQTTSSTDFRYLFCWIDHAVYSMDKVLVVAGEFDDRGCFLEIIQKIDDWVTDAVDGRLNMDRYQRKLLANNLGQDYFVAKEISIAAITLPSAFPKATMAIPELNLALAVLRISPDDPESRRFMATYQSPLIVKESLSEWPAMSKWQSPEYWHQKTLRSRRAMPVEIGHKYTDERWRVKFMRFRTFGRQLMLSKSSDHKQDESLIAYLAQHNIFDQIPSLQSDIKIPDECYIAIPEGYTDPPNIFGSAAQRPTNDVEKNIWMGPAGTISPLHYDPYHNVLCQVVGTKYIRLYSPEETPNLYPRKEGLMHNTSQVDVEAPREALDKDFPGFLEAKYVEGYLRAGEMLWLPKGWWHYIRGVETGISVSFWWS